MIQPSRPPMFKPGQKVVCIDGDFSLLLEKVPSTKQVPQEDKIYTVRTVIWLPPVQKYGLLLEEIRNPMIWTEQLGYIETTFNEKRFAPAEDKEAMETTLEEAMKFIKIRELETV